VCFSVFKDLKEKYHFFRPLVIVGGSFKGEGAGTNLAENTSRAVGLLRKTDPPAMEN
jgi:hypothetical protein